MNVELLTLCRLFFEAGLAIGLSFIFGFACGLAAMSYLRREKGVKGNARSN